MFRQPKTFLGVKKRLGEVDYNVTEIELEHGVSAGIYLRSLSADTVPPYYEHLYRIRAGISLDDWQNKSRTEKALLVAVMQNEAAVAGHQSEAEIQQAKQSAKRKE